ncbi:MAG: hypothetical protein DMD87_16605 [Candidatus Rokuibacteriota bacterium]|nr:MAG: hypothetical protein DMD87_16605 [Candidatus Rokubacteria bacterium]
MGRPRPRLQRRGRGDARMAGTAAGSPLDRARRRPRDRRLPALAAPAPRHRAGRRALRPVRAGAKQNLAVRARIQASSQQ